MKFVGPLGYNALTAVVALTTLRSYLQIVFARKAWMVLPPAVRPAFDSLFNCLLTSTVESTVKEYLEEINKFLLCCRTKKIALQLPISSSVVALYA